MQYAKIGFIVILVVCMQPCRSENMHFVPDEVNFADYHYVGTHNSHVYKRFFTTTYQHETDPNDQLNNGIRGFMLDIYPWNESELNPTLIKTNRRFGPGDSVMSHAKPGIKAFSQKGLTGWDSILAIVEYQTYQYELEKIIRFLQKNPREIIVIHMEDYVGIKKLSAETDEVVKRLGYDPLFRPTDWNIKQAVPDVWPTLGWMRQNNKRLLITTDAQTGGADAGINYGAIWSVRNFQSNIWGAINTCSDPRPVGCKPEEMCKPYWAAPNATVSFFNHFRSDAVTWALWDVERDSRYDVLVDAFNKCKNKNLFGGKAPNGVFTDRTVESVRDLQSKGIKTVFDLINEWNAQATQAAFVKTQK